jgi:hypothetical protein
MAIPSPQFPKTYSPDNGRSIYETSVNFYETKRRNIPEKCHLLYPLMLPFHPLDLPAGVPIKITSYSTHQSHGNTHYFTIVTTY